MYSFQLKSLRHCNYYSVKVRILVLAITRWKIKKQPFLRRVRIIVIIVIISNRKDIVRGRTCSMVQSYTKRSKVCIPCRAPGLTFVTLERTLSDKQKKRVSALRCERNRQIWDREYSYETSNCEQRQEFLCSWKCTWNKGGFVHRWMFVFKGKDPLTGLMSMGRNQERGRRLRIWKRKKILK